ncbi:hypothetical protein YPPY47_2712, partial [Yersinia pestis PY-47]
MSPSVTAT